MNSSPIPENPPIPERSASVTRRSLIAGIGFATAGAAAASLALWPRAGGQNDHHGFSLETPRTAEEVLTRLRAGNECYVREHFHIAHQSGDVLQIAVTANVRHQVENLLHSKAIVAPAVASKRVQIAGGVYELETGRVRLLSEVSE